MKNPIDYINEMLQAAGYAEAKMTRTPALRLRTAFPIENLAEKEVRVMKCVNWILVPIDFSEESRLALEAADRQAAHWGSGLILLHVKQLTEEPQTRMVIEEEAIRRCARWVEHVPQNQVSFLTCYGDPADGILQIARQYEPRKIIMGRGGNAQRPGSVTEAVGRGFPGLLEVISAARDDVYLHATVT